MNKTYSEKPQYLSREKLQDSLLKNAIANFPMSALTSMITTILLTYVLYDTDGVKDADLVIWVIYQSTIAITWLSIAYTFNKNPTLVKKWVPYFKLPLSALAGLGAGGAWFHFIDPSQMTTAFVLNAGVIAAVLGAIISTSLYMPSFYAYFAFCMGPIIGKSTYLGTMDLSNGNITADTQALFLWFAIVMTMLLLAARLYAGILNKNVIEILEERELNRLLAKALEDEKGQVEKVSREKTRFLAAASHDLRQPIQAMKLFEHVLDSELTDPKQKSTLAKIRESIDSITSLLESLLDISKLDAGVIKSKVKLIDIDAILYKLYEQYIPIAEQKGITLSYAPSHAYAYSDPQHLERIIGNLLSNAINHMETNGKILIGVRYEKNHHRIEVRDNGSGISKEHQKDIFDEFYQVKNQERNRTKGLGLGLSIVKRFSQLLGHEVQLKSELGQGSTFSIRIEKPDQHEVDQLPYEDTDINETSDQYLHYSKTNQSLNILVIDDDDNILASLEQLFLQQGHSVYTAQSQSEANDCFEKHSIDIILSDYQLQDNQDGIEAIQSLRTLSETPTPAILLTGNTDPAIQTRLHQHDIDILFKPVSHEQLNSKISELMHTT